MFLRVDGAGVRPSRAAFPAPVYSSREANSKGHTPPGWAEVSARTDRWRRSRAQRRGGGIEMRPCLFPVIFFFLNGNQRSHKLSHAPHIQAQIHLRVLYMFMQGRLLCLPLPLRFESGCRAPQQLSPANGTEVAWRSIIADVRGFFL